MILDEITIHNFGAYGGSQTATLTPLKRRPVVLIGGMNGGGKTTLLDAVQLAFYGSKAKLSNRGRLAYKDYLRGSMHRGMEEQSFTGVDLKFSRVIDGVVTPFELRRRWTLDSGAVQESLAIHSNGRFDEAATEHWEEEIEAYLPSGIAHLFFFDGEQVKELAEGGHAAEIIGTAIRSLLGLDLVDRLEADLKVLERRKKAELPDSLATAKIRATSAQLAEIDRAESAALMQEGEFVNEIGRLAKDLTAATSNFRTEGGGLYNKRLELISDLEAQKLRKHEVESRLKDLLKAALPMASMIPLMERVETRLSHEKSVNEAKALFGAIEVRDANIVSAIEAEDIPEATVSLLRRTLELDRKEREGRASEATFLDGASLESICRLRLDVIPSAVSEAAELSKLLRSIEERLLHIELEISRVPTQERIAGFQRDMDEAQTALDSKKALLSVQQTKISALRREKTILDAKLAQLEDDQVDAIALEDGRTRILKHSVKVRGTLSTFRRSIVQKHTITIERLMYECFQQLLSKRNLVTGLTIDPETFEPKLTGQDGQHLPIDRLSAGERQLLATAMLWGLARASGRPVPTIIDTPLGRLDSVHRANLVEQYFPNAAHQVILLSTDEEIVDNYQEHLSPHVARTYVLAHDKQSGATTIREGYF